MVLACTLMGCSVDDARTLGHASSDGAGGAAGDTGNGGNAGQTWLGCGEAGGGGDANSTHCWSFDHDTEGWAPEPSVTQDFSAEDASADPTSGSLTITNVDVGDGRDLVTAGADQCLPVPYATTYAVEFEALLPAQASIGGASVELTFVNVPGCQGIILREDQYGDETALSWRHVTAHGMVPRNTRSVLFRLLVDKFHSDPPFMASFDHVRLDFE